MEGYKVECEQTLENRGRRSAWLLPCFGTQRSHPFVRALLGVSGHSLFRQFRLVRYCQQLGGRLPDPRGAQVLKPRILRSGPRLVGRSMFVGFART